MGGDLFPVELSSKLDYKHPSSTGYTQAISNGLQMNKAEQLLVTRNQIIFKGYTL